MEKARLDDRVDHRMRLLKEPCCLFKLNPIKTLEHVRLVVEDLPRIMGVRVAHRSSTGKVSATANKSEGRRRGETPAPPVFSHRSCRPQVPPLGLLSTTPLFLPLST